MALVKKTMEMDQEQINRIRLALNAKTEKEAVNRVLRQFDAEIQISEFTLKKVGKFNFESVFKD